MIKKATRPSSTAIELDPEQATVFEGLVKRIQAIYSKYNTQPPVDLELAVRCLPSYGLVCHEPHQDAECAHAPRDGLDDVRGRDGRIRLMPCRRFTHLHDLAATLWMAAQSVMASGSSKPSPVQLDEASCGMPSQTRCPIPYSGEEPAMDFGERPLLGKRHIRPSQLHHVMALGETGAGKTQSCVLNLLNAAVGYGCDGFKSSVLVIDPKKDLQPCLMQQAQRVGRENDVRVLGHVQGETPMRIRLFSGALQGLSIRERYFKICELIPECAYTGTDSDRWLQKGHELSLGLLSLDAGMRQRYGIRLLETSLQLLSGKQRTLTQWEALDGIYQWVSSMAHLRTISLLWDTLLELVGVGMDLFNPLRRLASMSHEGFNQWLYESRMARMVSAQAGSPLVGQLLDLDLVHEVNPESVEWADLLDRGLITLYQPEHTSEHNFCARVLKAGFFQACLTRRELLRPVFYVADEFQRFATLEGDSAEVHFLDRCRAFRVSCVLATQSYASLQTVYRQEAALRCLVNNIPTLLIFRTKDHSARHLIWEGLRPTLANVRHVLDVRPIEHLRTGEYYYLCPTGNGRIQAPLPTV